MRGSAPTAFSGVGGTAATSRECTKASDQLEVYTSALVGGGAVQSNRAVPVYARL